MRLAPNPVHINPHRSPRNILNSIQKLTRLAIVLERVEVLEQLWFCCVGAVVDADPLGDLTDENEMDGELLHSALGERKRGGVVLNPRGQAAGQVAVEQNAERILGGEGLQERDGHFLGDACAIKEEGTDGVVPVRVLLEVKGTAIEPFKGILRVKAEDKGRFPLAAAETGVVPGNRKVRALDPREVIGMLYHEAPVDSPSQVGNVQGIDVQSLNLDAGGAQCFVGSA
jgi:hypothetical protein